MKKAIVFLPLLALMFSAGFSQLASINANEACFGEQTYLVGSSDSVIASWKWDLDDDNQFDDAYSQNAFFTYQSADTFPVRLWVTSIYGTTDTVSKQVVVHPLPSVNFQGDNMCSGKAATFTSSSTITTGTINQYLWDFDNNNVVDDNSGSVVSYNCGTPQTFLTKLTCVSDKGCSSFTIKTTTVYPQPVADFTATSGCTNTPLSFSNTSTIDAADSITINLWSFGDGSQGDYSGNPQHSYNAAQNYSVRLVTISSNNCRDTISKSLTVYPNPAFSIIITGDSVLYEGLTATLSVSDTVTSYLWSTGATTSTLGVTASDTFTLKGTDGNGCSATDTIIVTFEKLNETVLLVNDILTPNNDGKNDFLVIDDIAIYTSCTISVYNIWGDEVFSSTNYKNDWDGSYKGNPLPAGSYYYLIQCDDEEQKVGNVNILR